MKVHGPNARARHVQVEAIQRSLSCWLLLSSLLLCWPGHVRVEAAEALPVVPTAGQPLAANVQRVLDALEFLGAPWPAASAAEVRAAIAAQGAARLQELLDAQALFLVELNPESRVKARRGPARAILQQAGFTPVLLKIVNHSTVTKELRLSSPQAGPVYAGMTPLSAQRMQRGPLRETEVKTADAHRFLEVEWYGRSPMTPELSGAEVEYALALLYSSEPGQHEATVAFDVGLGTPDLGFRADVPVLLEVQPAVPVHLRVRDHDGKPTTAAFTFRDAAGHVFPPQAKRLAPDFYFQPQVYRADGEQILLPPGQFQVEYHRGPEYRLLRKEVLVPRAPRADLEFRLERWFNAADYGFFCGDHHIHGAGCAHYTSPTEGVTPRDMFRQVIGEGLNVGCVLTWGPCFDYQRRFFRPSTDQLSEALTLMKYDLEISGFGSEALGHVCLLNLRDQTYPGSDGTKARGWPTWTLPVLRWAKAQGGVTGYAHAASGLEINSQSATRRLLTRLDRDGDGLLSRAEALAGKLLLPVRWSEADTDRDGFLSEAELWAAHELAAERLPNFAIPEMNGVGAMEIGVTVAAGACDFISAMDTARIQEWNMWYHLLNCGFALKVSGETDFPCMSGERVGQGRVYVQLGRRQQIEFTAWCQALALGRSYVSDGFAHAPLFTVQGVAPGYEPVRLPVAAEVEIRAQVIFAPATPRTVAQGLVTVPNGRRLTGDSVTLHGPRRRELASGGDRLVELVMNGNVVSSNSVPADGQLHELRWRVPVRRSSWVALRQFPQLHTNPVNVLLEDAPIHVSQASARWVAETIERLWEQRRERIAENERAAARQAYDEALTKLWLIRDASPAGETQY